MEYNARKRARLKIYRARNRRLVECYLETHPCIDCGLFDPLVMEFDHVTGTKVNDVRTLVREAAAMHVLEAEIAKCVVRCANCHRRRTALTLWGKVRKEGFSEMVAGPKPDRGDCSSVG